LKKVSVGAKSKDAVFWPEETVIETGCDILTPGRYPRLHPSLYRGGLLVKPAINRDTVLPESWVFPGA
jgi:hypothetical protein